jgi:hypothetical protein
VFTVLVLAFVIDYSHAGTAGMLERIPFMMALPAIADGWQSSWLANHTVGWLGSAITYGLHHSGSAYLAGASGNACAGALIGLVELFSIACLLPASWGRRFKLGRVTSLKFSSISFGKGESLEEGLGGGATTGRLNPTMWFCSIFLGLMWPTVQGSIGTLLRAEIVMFAGLVKPIPNWLFGTG